jgi:hypothetical protein
MISVVTTENDEKFREMQARLADLLPVISGTNEGGWS